MKYFFFFFLIRSLAGYSGIYRGDAATLSWFFSSKLDRSFPLQEWFISSQKPVSCLFRGEVKTKTNNSVIRSLAGYSGIYRKDVAALSWFFSSKLGRPKMLSVTRMIHIISKTRVSRLFRSFVSPDAWYWSSNEREGVPDSTTDRTEMFVVYSVVWWVHGEERYSLATSSGAVTKH